LIAASVDTQGDSLLYEYEFTILKNQLARAKSFLIPKVALGKRYLRRLRSEYFGTLPGIISTIGRD
jgi:hypothetical protein